MSGAERSLVHASCVVLPGGGVLVRGPSGSGKSDLALRLIDGGAQLVSDDQTCLARRADGVWASPPGTLAGRLEVRGLGIVRLPHRDAAPVVLVVDLVAAEAVERLPEPATAELLGVALPRLALWPFAASAAALVRLAASRVREA